MYFVIVGAGRVGLRTARVLRDSDHTVVIVEKESDAIERARDEGFEVVANTGPMSDALAEADVESADALGALTDDLNTNFAACMIGKEAGCRTVMRFDETHSEEIYRNYADEVDEIIHPENLTASITMNALTGGSVRAIADMQQSLQLVEFTLTDASPMHGFSLQELELPGNARLLAYASKGESPRLPSSNDVLSTGDRLVVLIEFENRDAVQQLIVGEAGTKVLST